MRGIEAGRTAASGRERRGAENLRAGRFTQRPGGDAVVAMGVGDEDGLDPLALHRRQQRPEMRLVVRTRIDDRDRAFADDIGAGAVEGEGEALGAMMRRTRGESRVRARGGAPRVSANGTGSFSGLVIAGSFASAPPPFASRRLVRTAMRGLRGEDRRTASRVFGRKHDRRPRHNACRDGAGRKAAARDLTDVRADGE